MGDSVIATMDTYDQRVWAIGKGPSAMTVSAPDLATTLGSPVLIKGQITDVSPGTKSSELSLRFSNGVPAVSDASMSEWMLYVYKQFPKPTNATGVEVTISAVDSNGNYRELGKTTSSSDGFFSLPWTPDIAGQYKVYASFGGSESYYPSHAETAFIVAEKPDTTPAPTIATQQLVSETYFIPAIAGIIVVMILGFAVLMLMMQRKRP
jgi:hypothetical protein